MKAFQSLKEMLFSRDYNILLSGIFLGLATHDLLNFTDYLSLTAGLVSLTIGFWLLILSIRRWPSIEPFRSQKEKEDGR